MTVPAAHTPDPHWSHRLDLPRLRRCDSVAWQELDGEAVLQDSATGATHHLNGTALDVWKALDGRTDAAEIARQLVERYTVCTHLAESDVEELLVILAEAGLVAECGA